MSKLLLHVPTSCKILHVCIGNKLKFNVCAVVFRDAFTVSFFFLRAWTFFIGICISISLPTHSLSKTTAWQKK